MKFRHIRFIEEIAPLRQEFDLILGLEQTETSVELHSYQWPENQNILIAVGNEGKGLPQEILDICDTNLEIEQRFCMSEPPNASRSGFFDEDNGNQSSMRLMCFVSLIAAICFGILTVLNSGQNQNNSEGIYITFGFLISAFAPKAVQKFAEQKIK